MITLDLAAGAGWLMMSIAFVVARSRTARFNAACAALWLAVMVTLVALPDRQSRPAETAAIGVGLSLYWFGLLILRTMLTRSVSLHLLIALARGSHEVAFDDRIADRVNEAVRYRLVRTDGGRLTLSPAGVGLAKLLRVLYRMARLPG